MTGVAAGGPGELELLSDLGVGVLVFDLDGRVVDGNAYARQVIPMGDVSEGRLDDLVLGIVDEHERPVRRDVLPVFRALRGTRTVPATVLGFRLADGSGRIAWVVMGAHLVCDDSTDAPRHVLCSFVDITVQRAALDAVHESERRFRLFAENAVDMIFRLRVRPDAAVEYVNPAVEMVLGYRPEEFYADVGLMVQVIHPDDWNDIDALFRAAAAQRADEVPEIVVRLTRRDGATVWAHFRAVAVRQGGDVVAYEGVIRDVTVLKTAEADLTYRASHDSLTGLPNRAHLLEVLERALARSRVDDSGVAVLYVDLDRFKTVNDHLGHEAGDRVLCEVAARLAEAVRPSDRVARIGGDEFAAVLPDIRDADEGARIAQRLLDALRVPVPLDGSPLVTTASIGLAFTRGGSETPAELLRRADVAMYSAKDRGRARAEWYTAPGSAAADPDGPG